MLESGVVKCPNLVQLNMIQHNLLEGNLVQYQSSNTAVSLGTGKVWPTKIPEKLYMSQKTHVVSEFHLS